MEARAAEKNPLAQGPGGGRREGDRGESAPAREPEKAPSRESREREREEGRGDRQRGELGNVTDRHAPVLEQRGEGARLLQAALFRTDGKVFRIEVGTGEPLRDPARVARLFAERLHVINDEIDPGFGFDVVRLCALVTERSDPQQTGLAASDHAAVGVPG